MRHFICLISAFLTFVLPAWSETEPAIYFNELMVSNLDQFVDPSWNYGAWAEIYNATESDLQLRGYWISIDQSKLKMVRITQSTIVPKGGYKALWFGHHDKYCLSQLDLKLDPEGGELYLSNSSGVIVASVAYPPIPPRSSYARISDGKNEWMLSSTPTPGKQNIGMTFCTERLAAPVITKESQIFSNSMVFSVGIPTGCILRYTTDGSTPTLKNGSTSTNGYFNLNSTKVYRFALFREGYLSSPVVTRTFILKDKNFSLPIISVVTAPQNLYSDTLGIFVKGTKGRAGRGQSSRCNWNMEWDRPCNFEFLDAEGHSLVNQEAEMKRCGGWSRAYTPYSFKIHAVKNYEDKKTLDYPFFDAKPYLKHKVLQIRNGGNDYSCRVKDAFLQQVVATSGLDIDYQEYTPVVHYINGVYKGVINMREPSNKQHVYANYGLDEDEIDLFEMDPDSGYVQMCGNKDAWKTLYSYSRLVIIDSYYQKVCEMIDVDEFCNYLAVELYLGSTDWPQNNLKAFRPIADGGRFRFILYDLDHSFNTTSPFSTFAGKKTYTFNTLYGEPVTNYTKEIEVVTIFQNLLKNASFRKKFIDTFCLVAGSVFEPHRCEELMNRLANRVNDMQVLNDNGYNRNSSPWGTTNTMISNLNSRQATLIQALKSYSAFELSNTTEQKVKLESNISTAKLQVNGIVVPTGRFDGTLFQPVTLKATAPKGYRFLGWNRTENQGEANMIPLIEKGATWNYYDKGPLNNSDWILSNYQTSDWNNGKAPLGYSNTLEFGTRISYGSNSSQKYPAYYFRHTFHLDDLGEEGTKFKLNYLLDDGMVVYVNGKEAARYNMPAGTITGTTFSTTYASETPFDAIIELDRSLFRKGENLIAVEVHNNSGTSSDIYWDAALWMEQPFQYSEDMDFVSTEQELQLPSSKDMISLTACFAKQSSTEQEQTRCPVVINEVSAGNSIYVNEYFKKNDWIELYNLTGDDFDLEGCYLSDDPKKPLKYRISASEADTKIPAHGYKIVWCDKLPTGSQLHADFKLENSEGSMVLLTAADQSWSDSLVYCIHDGMQSVGRFPDGGDELYVMPHPTIAHENMMSSYATRWEPTTTDPDGIDFKQSHMAGISLAYSHDALIIKSEEDMHPVLRIYSTGGQLVLSQQLEMSSPHERITISPLAPGIYVAQLEDNDGNRCSIKFSK